MRNTLTTLIYGSETWRIKEQTQKNRRNYGYKKQLWTKYMRNN